MIINPKKFAQTVIRRKNLVPPIDIMNLIKQYADLEIETEIPYDFDAVCFFDNSKPHIILNGNIPHTRQSFTLAHELGHIIMPGHKSIIACNTMDSYCDSIENYQYDETTLEYYEREKEANEFASEILMPTNWIRDIIYKSKSYQEAFTEIYSLTGLSVQAIAIAIINHFKPGIILIIEHENIQKPFVFISSSTLTSQFSLSRYNLQEDPKAREMLVTISKRSKKFFVQNYQLTLYDIYEDIIFKSEIKVPNKRSTDILMDYLNLINNSKEATRIFRRINGILSNINSRKKINSMSEEEYYSQVQNRFRNKVDLKEVVASVAFHQYIAKRYEELSIK